MENRHVGIAKLKIRNALVRAGAKAEGAVDVFFADERGALRYDEDADTLFWNNLPIERALAERPQAAARYCPPDIVVMSHSAYKAAVLSGQNLGDPCKIRLVADDPPPRATPGANTMTTTEYKQAMLRGDQGLDKVTMLVDD